MEHGLNGQDADKVYLLPKIHLTRVFNNIKLIISSHPTKFINSLADSLGRRNFL